MTFVAVSLALWLMWRYYSHQRELARAADELANSLYTLAELLETDKNDAEVINIAVARNRRKGVR